MLDPPAGLTAGGHRYRLSAHAAPAWEAVAPGEELSARVARSGAVDEAIGARRGDGTLEWRAWCDAMTRLSRRLVAGEAAAEDTLLSEIVARATAAKGRGARQALAGALRRRTALYLQDPDPASFLGRMAGAGAGADTVVAAVAHALALVSEAATTTALQALALHTVEPRTGPEESVALALRRYPPVAAAVYRVRAPFVWEDLAVGAGTEILCAPGWLPEPQDGPGPGVWPSALCAGPSDCAATRFAVLVAGELVRAITAAARPFVVAPLLAPGRLPGTLDARSLLVALGEHSGCHGDGRVTVGRPTALPVRARGYAPASYGALARASAERLEAHAESLAACADTGGWDKDEAGENFRVALLDHAQRCAEAADGVRRAANRLAD